jgi:AAA+ ATPase superfamily predicted ATPase
MKIIGRKYEQNAIKKYVESSNPEFVAVYGRRRVGKTFLIREYFENSFTFYHTGLANAGKQEQLSNFNHTLNFYGKIPYPLVQSWLDAFRQLIHLLEHSAKKSKKVVFIDELPWMDTPRSGFITALEYFWNSWASARPDLLLIVCGSSTSWMINKLINNHGGLHNRITHRMILEPFTLGECEAFYQQHKIVMDRHQIVESYMILGGVPYYLSLMDKSLSLPQNIDALCFAKNGELREEFPRLYASLFRNSENHVKVVEALGQKVKGLTRDEIIKISKLQGGGLTQTLEELEQCGFIRKYQAFEKKTKSVLYQLVDFYSLFYLNFIRHANNNDIHYWSNINRQAKHKAWSGYAFEMVCLEHLEQIRTKLGISGVVTTMASWRSRNVRATGAQIDLLLERNDHIINLCEMKYADTEFVIDKKYNENLRNKRATFVGETKTRKTVHITMITTYGVKHNEYWGNIQSEVTIDDLF